jgi:hypothetical protein
MDRVSRTVWAVAERGGEAKMKREEIVALLQAEHPFLKREGLGRAVFLVNYYAWHEGYDKFPNEQAPSMPFTATA